MKPSANEQRITLFPFLAVLICTMGALLVLLIVISKRAQATAQTQREALAAAAAAEDTTHQQALESETEKLAAARDEVAARLAEGRRTLAHIEDHMRRLGEAIRSLQQVEKQLAENPASGDDLDSLKRRLSALLAEKEEIESLIDELRQSNPEQASYRIIPYHGNSGTQRRPIYLECREDGVYFQPEGIHLSEKDFLRPLGPENPLAAGLRAQSSFLREHRSTDAFSHDPYPLLVVRPSGIPAYYAARIAIRSWESDFGYELVDEDTQLDFGTPDPKIARITREAINIARPRHQFMVARAERLQLAGGLSSTASRANGRGRMVETGQGDDGRGFAGGRGQSWDDANRNDWDDSRRHGTDIDRNRGALRRAESVRKSENPAAPLTPPASGAGDSPNPSTTAVPSPAKSGAQLPSSGGPQASSSPDQPPALSLSLGSSNAPSSTEHSPISDVRGKNWALPGASSGAVPFQRSVRIELTPEAITLYSTDPRQSPETISFDASTRDTIEQLVSGIWEHMEHWGIAGRGMYWRPVLNIYVSPGAKQRAIELQQLLKQSGLQINYFNATP